jgi:hypothetical protein
VLYEGNICRLADVVAVLVWERSAPVVREPVPTLPLTPAPDDPVVAFFGRRGRGVTRLLSCYFRSSVLGRPADAPLAIDQPEGGPVLLSLADWDTLRAWLTTPPPPPP